MAAAALRVLPLEKQDIERARRSGSILAPLVRGGRPLTVKVRDPQDTKHEESIELPADAVALLMKILEDMAAGHVVTLIPENAELTTQQAANALRVSRPFLIKLLEANKLPFRMVGKHRRIRFEDVQRYKAEIDAERRKALDSLVADAQELDMGY